MAHFIYYLFIFSVINLRKNICERTLTLELLPLPIRVRTLLAGPHLHLSERRFFMNDPQEPVLIVRYYIPMSKTWMLVVTQQTFVVLEDVLKTSSRHVLKMSSTRLQRNNFTSSKTS